MDTEIKFNSTSKCIPISRSVSCSDLNIKEFTVQQQTGATANVIDVNPSSSRNCGPKSMTPIALECYVDPVPWFKRNPDSLSVHSCESVVCRICHNSENPEKLVSPCFCKGSLTYVHLHCLERWISTSRCTTCELCQFQYNTRQTLRYSFFQSLCIWYSRSMSRRALQEDCQMFSLLTLVAFGIIGTLMVAVQYYILQGHLTGLGRLWTKGWLIFSLFTTVILVVYFINVYMIAKTQLAPWYRWWQSARDIHLILENHKPFYCEQFKSHSQMQRHLQMQNQTLVRPPQPQPQPQPQTQSLSLSQPPLPQQNPILLMTPNATTDDTSSIVLESNSINTLESMPTECCKNNNNNDNKDNNTANDGNRHLSMTAATTGIAEADNNDDVKQKKAVMLLVVAPGSETSDIDASTPPPPPPLPSSKTDDFSSST